MPVLKRRYKHWGNPPTGEMKRKKEVLPLRIKARLLMSDSGTLIGACEAGAGIGQILEIGCRQLLHSGKLIELSRIGRTNAFLFIRSIPRGCTARQRSGRSSSSASKS
jgi:hypothetical protein